jgi:hypothetical protein
VLNRNGLKYISPSGLDERYFDEDEYQKLLKQGARQNDRIGIKWAPCDWTGEFHG